MKLKRLSHGFVSDDGARLQFPKQKNLTLENDEPEPTKVDAFIAGWTGSVQPATRSVPIADMEHIVSCKFQEEVCQHGIVISAKRFHAYKLTGECHPLSRLLLVSDTGGGLKFMLLCNITPEVFRGLCEATKARGMDANVIWRLIQSYFATYEKAHQEGIETTQRLFLDGRLKARRKKGALWCEILPVSQGKTARNTQ